MAYPESIDKFTEKLNKLDNNTYVIEEEIQVTDGVYEGELHHDNVSLPSINVYTGSKLTGTKIENVIVSTPSLTPWKKTIKIFSSVSPVYITYQTQGDTVEAEDINKVQDSIVNTQIALNAEKDRAIDREDTIEDNLNIEINRAKNREDGIEDDLNSEISRAENAENTLTNNLNAEINRAKGAENVLTNNLNSEANRATQSENNINTALTGEINRAKQAENAISNTINTNKPNWDDKYTKNEIDNKISQVITDLDWKEAVSTFADIATTYPSPEDGWTVNVKDTDITYRYSGTGWVAISANSIPLATSSVDGKMSKQDKINLDDTNSKKHTHNNLSILQTITQALIDAWNAVSHKSDVGHKHVRVDITDFPDVYTKNEVDTSIDAIQVGGRNLIKNGDFLQSFSNWTKNGSDTTIEVISDSRFGQCCKVSTPTTVHGIYNVANNYAATVNEEGQYTYSAWLKADAPMQVNFGLDSSKVAINITTEWVRYTCTAIKAVGKNNILCVYKNGANTGETLTFYVANAKLEVGNKATDWTPAPEDIQNQLENKSDVGHTHDDRYYTETESNNKFATKDEISNAGYGDMLKSVYDTNGNGIVDKAEDSNTVGGKSVNDFTKRVILTGQLQKNSYRRSVIALCELTNTNPSLNSYSTGIISFKRGNGITELTSLYVGAEKLYNSSTMHYFGLGLGRSPDLIRPCTFTYNGNVYGGIEFKFSNAESNQVEFNGSSTFNIFGLDYYDTQNNVPLNEEVNNSLNFDTTINKLPNLLYNNDKISLQKDVVSKGCTWNDLKGV
ncbi:hypothetical protein [Clostridium kluyveri]|uniref:hypothetical protein n=1 Tax=Clostridium kluyveri TaxID=1534 RepID=UPI000AF2EB5D|nr:hypothetical protein [Clostridium kluyveri]